METLQPRPYCVSFNDSGETVNVDRGFRRPAQLWFEFQDEVDRIKQLRSEVSITFEKLDTENAREGHAITSKSSITYQIETNYFECRQNIPLGEEDREYVERFGLCWMKIESASEPNEGLNSAA